ncbi:DNA-3-methyladenine glycosylase I [Candidatus Dependentiae bacterium]|nr:DNA-3-methyladenine glycosylase I [Candidatus Dependentiae bacterium]
MNKNSYTITFNQILRRIKNLSISTRVEEHLQIREDLNSSALDDIAIFKKMSAVIFSSGFNATVVKDMWPELKIAFKGFDFEIVEGWTEKEIEELMKNKKIIRNKNKIKAIIFNAKVFNELIKEYGSFQKFLSKQCDPEKIHTYIEKRFHYLGKITTYDFLKRIGLNFMKPDIHIRRLYKRLGWLNSMSDNNKNLNKIFEISDSISNDTKLNLNYIDGVFWLFCSGYKDVMTMAVCGAVPKCNICYVNHCKSREVNFKNE